MRCTPGEAIGCRGDQQPMSDARSVGGAGQPDPSLPQLGVARRRLREARARHQRPAAARRLSRSERALTISSHELSARPTSTRTRPRRCGPEAAAAMKAALARAATRPRCIAAGRAARHSGRARPRGGRGAGRRDARRGGFHQRRHRGEPSGAARQRPRARPGSAVEHGSVLAGSARAPRRIPVDSDGVVDLAALRGELAADPRPALVSVMLANNETGVVQPVARDRARSPMRMARCSTAMRCRRPARSAVGRGRARRRSGQPVGAQNRRAAWHRRADRRRGAEIAAMLRGGGQERGRRAGTENLPGIAGFAAAAAAAIAGSAEYERVRRAARPARSAALAAVPRRVVIGAEAPGCRTRAALAMPGIAAETQMIALDLDGVDGQRRRGLLVGQGRAEPVLAAMGAAGRHRRRAPSGSAWAGQRRRPTSPIFSTPGRGLARRAARKA